MARKPEHALQVAAKQWLTIALPPEVLWTAVDHGSHFSSADPDAGMRQWARLKARGVKTGIPDLHFWWNGVYLAVELKTGDGRANDTQGMWLDRLRRNGFRGEIAYTLEDLDRHLREAGFPVQWALPPVAPKPAAGPKKRTSKPRPPRPTKRALKIAASFYRP